MLARKATSFSRSSGRLMCEMKMECPYYQPNFIPLKTSESSRTVASPPPLLYCHPSSEGGFSLFSALIALGLVGLILSYTIPAVHSLVGMTMRVRQEAHAQRLAARLSTIAGQIMQDIDTHRLSLGVRVHSIGSITYQSGRPHEVMQGSSNIRPNDSNAITVAALDSTAVLIPRSITAIQASKSWFEGCVIPGGKTPLSPHRSFLAVSADGVAEVVADSFGCLSNGCCSGYLRTEDSLLTPPTESKRILLTLPINRQLTYYVSERKELRLFQQVGDSMIENQPLFANVPRLTFSISFDITPGISISSEDLPLKNYPIHQYGSLPRLPIDYLLGLIS
jgi:hypothetical protein